MMSPRFTSPPDPRAFNASVWEIVRMIPPGKVATYGQIGSLVPVPQGLNSKDYATFAPRWVGSAMANCPEGIPWQRVINSQGKISLKPDRGGRLQKELLLAEGIIFNEREAVDLSIFGWSGPQT